MGADLTNFSKALKELYPSNVVQDLVYKKNPFLALVSKATNFEGKNMPIPLIYGNPQAQGANFATAQAKTANTAAKVDAFALTRVRDYSLATIDNETILASKSDKGAFISALETNVGGAINTLRRSIGKSIFRSGTGALGVRGSVSGSTLTLATAADIVNFEVDMVLVAAPDDVVGTTVRTGTITITALDRLAGKFTFSGSITSFADNDVLFISGDQISAGTIAVSKISGLEAWLPTTAPTSGDNFFGVDRSKDVVRLAGLRKSYVGVPIEEALIDATELMDREGASPDYMFLSHTKYAELKNALGTKVHYVDVELNPRISFRGIQVEGGSGTIKVMPDLNCPIDRGYMTQLDTWKFWSLGEMVGVLNSDSLDMLRQATADGVEVRYGGYFNLGCNAPGWNMNLQF